MVYTLYCHSIPSFLSVRKETVCVGTLKNLLLSLFMPIGVPKVPYRLPGEEDASYIDIYNLLYRERILFLAQAVNDEICNRAN